MTYTISPGHDWRYLTEQVGRGKENYYLEGTSRGEPPGIWQGRGAEALGLRGEVNEQDMEALFGHFVDPRDPAFRERDSWGKAAKLGRPPRKYASPEQILAKRLVSEPDATPERIEQLRAQAEKEARRAVAFLDLTFSPPKSVTILHTSFRAQELAAQRAGDRAGAELWGRRAHVVEQAIWAGNNAGLDYWARYAGYSRAGYHGRRDPDGASVGRYVDGHDWVVASFWQHTSRAGDPQLHIHNPVLNRVQNPDGQWRTLDSRAMHRVRPAAAAVAERVMFEALSRDLGVSVAQRPDGKALEITTIPSAARELFSTRRRAVTEGVAKRVEAFRRRYGREPNALELSRLSQAVTLETRPGKDAEVPTMVEELDQWSAQLRAELDLSMEEVATQSVGRVQAGGGVEPFEPDRVVEQALARVQATKAVWTRHDLIRAINDELPGCLGGLRADHVQRLLEELADQAIRPDPESAGSSREVIRLSAPELLPPPEQYRRADGRSQFEAPTSEVYARATHLQAEERLVAAARETGAPMVELERVEAVLEKAAQAGRPLGADQAAAVTGVLTSGRRLEVLIGLAGAGKSYTVATLARAWEQEVGGRVFGIGPSERAASVLRGEGLESLNYARWLDRQQRIQEGRASEGEQEWQLQAGDLVVVDEAGMMATDVLDRIRGRVQAAGAKLLVTGDDAQLPAVGAGGGLRLLSQHARTYELAEVRRMAAGWEREASARLRARDPDVVAVYARHGRLVDGGTGEEAAEAAGRAWLAATLRGRRALLTVDTVRQAADLSDKLRARLVDLGLVEEGGERIGYREDESGERLWTVAGVGDVIETRRNRWDLTDSAGRAVLNHDLYQVVGRPGDGALEVRRISYDENGREELGPVLTLPREYVEEHVTLGYAVTAHSGQGATVQVSYPVVTQSTSAAALYVGMSRGVEENTAFVETLQVGESEAEPRDPEKDERRRPPAAVVAGILERDEPVRPALEVERANLEHAGSLVALGAQWTTAVEQLTKARYAELVDRLVEKRALTPRQRKQLANDEAVGPLWRLVRAAELAGHDPEQLLTKAIGARKLKGAKSIARVLHHRLTERLEGKLVAVADTYRDRTPVDDSDVGEWARGLAEAMDARMSELGERVAEKPPEWALRRLGPVPEDPLERAGWVSRAGRIEAYREQYLEEPDAVDAIGPCPPVGAAEARAGWYAAWRALGEPEERRAEAELSVEALRARVDAYRREEAWAPDWVGEELEATAGAARQHDVEAALLHAQARAETDPQRRAELVTRASAHRALALELEEARKQLEQVDEARGRWYLATAEKRALAEAAKAELERREMAKRAEAQGAAAGRGGDEKSQRTECTRASEALKTARRERPAARATETGRASTAGSAAASERATASGSTVEATPAAKAEAAPAKQAEAAPARKAEATRAKKSEATPAAGSDAARMSGGDGKTVEQGVWAAAGLKRPDGVPAPSEVATRVQRAREALRILEERERAEREAEQRERELAAEEQRRQRERAGERQQEAPVLARAPVRVEAEAAASAAPARRAAPATGDGQGNGAGLDRDASEA